MPGYKGHLLGGFVVFLLLFFGLVSIKVSLLTACEWLLFSLAGSLFPDVDIKSKGQKYFYYVVLLVFAALTLRQRFDMLACCSFIFITPMLVRHRGFFHSPRFVIAVPMLCWIIVSFCAPHISNQFFCDVLFFIAGALSHIWLDFGFRQMMWRLFH